MGEPSVIPKVVLLDIGGFRYATTAQTLLDGPHCPPREQNFFQALLNGKTASAKVGEHFFIDRDGKYFEPILEYLRTGDVVIPKGMNVSSIVREAEFYGIKFPLAEDSPHLLYINDEWLSQKKVEQEYNYVCHGGDELLHEVLTEFKHCAMEGRKIQSLPFLRELRDNSLTATASKIAKLASRQHETQDIKTALEQQAMKFYADKKDRVNGHFFRLLDDRQARSILIERCRRNDLTVDVVPCAIRVNWKGTESHWTVGYSVVHCPEKM